MVILVQHRIVIPKYWFDQYFRSTLEAKPVEDYMVVYEIQVDLHREYFDQIHTLSNLYEC